MTERFFTADKDGKTMQCVDIRCTTAEIASLPTKYCEGSTAYCYKGDKKGSLFIFDGATWEEQ